MTEGTLVFDDDCGFCTWWAEFFEGRSDVRTVGFSELAPELRDRLPETYENCSHFVTDDRVYSCGASIEEAFARSNLGSPTRPLIDFLRTFEDYERTRERAYRHVADDRARWGRLLSKTPPVRRDSGD